MKTSDFRLEFPKLEKVSFRIHVYSDASYALIMDKSKESR